MEHHHNTPYLDARTQCRLDAARRRAATAQDLTGVMAAAAASDAKAWCTLVERFTGRLRAVARAHRLSADDAEDVVQTAWLRLFERIDSLREPGAVGAWLEVTATRESRRLLRNAQRVAPAPIESFAEPAIPPIAEQRLLAIERRAALNRALGRLSRAQQRLFRELLADESRTYEEISAELDIPIGGIGPTRARGIERLRSDSALMTVLGGPDDDAVGAWSMT